MNPVTWLIDKQRAHNERERLRRQETREKLNAKKEKRDLKKEQQASAAQTDDTQEILCRRCNNPVDLDTFAATITIHLIVGSITAVIGLGVMTIVTLIGLPILAIGALVAIASPLTALLTRGKRRCAGCDISWMPSEDAKKAINPSSVS